MVTSIAPRGEPAVWPSCAFLRKSTPVSSVCSAVGEDASLHVEDDVQEWSREVGTRGNRHLL
jgi:hypothetical protein